MAEGPRYGLNGSIGRGVDARAAARAQCRRQQTSVGSIDARTPVDASSQ